MFNPFTLSLTNLVEKEQRPGDLGAFMRCFIEPEKRTLHLSNLPLPSLGLENTTWESCAEALKLLRTAYTTTLGGLEPAIIEKYRIACKDQFPMANLFLTSAERDDLRARMVEAGSNTAVCGVYVTYTTEADVYSVPYPAALVQPFNSLSLCNETIVNGDAEDSSDNPCKAPVNNLNKKTHNLDTGRTQLPASTF
ncbi:unnamed protein product [Echinostoma caproni]|uniref:Uncharacterized protein n=1 Tax=Echinostoma caproni TaxID=27848 RepID=A0A183B1F6_9TREM|nr:unnamed protein product [Echinostoma caproni]